MQKHAELIKKQRPGKYPRRSPIRRLCPPPLYNWGTMSKEPRAIHSTVVIANSFHCLAIPTVRNFFLMLDSNPSSLNQFPAAFVGNGKQLFCIIWMTTSRFYPPCYWTFPGPALLMAYGLPGSGFRILSHQLLVNG